MWLFLLFIIIPIIEITLFIKIGGLIGLGWTLFGILFTAVLGSFILRKQGMNKFNEVQLALQGKADLASSLAHGALLLVSAVLLITPGFFTDFIGFSLFIPGVRTFIIHTIKSRIVVMQSASFEKHHQGYSQKTSTTIIEGEYSVNEPDENTRKDG